MKKWWRYAHILKSRTVSFILAVQTYFTFYGAETVQFLQQELPGFQEYIPDNAYKLGMFTLAVGALALRFKTYEPIKNKIPKKKETQ